MLQGQKNVYTNIKPLKAGQRGIVLLEALIAILIFSMGILALVGLQSAMVKNTTDTKFRGDASYIAQQRIGQIWADAASATSYAESSVDISGTLPGGKRTVEVSGTSVRVTVGWTEPGETAAASSTTAPCFMQVAHCYTTTATVAENN